jgi:hypothetical protein
MRPVPETEGQIPSSSGHARTLRKDLPPSGFLPTAIITQLGSPGGGPSHYRHF